MTNPARQPDQSINANNYHQLCDQLAGQDPDLRKILALHGYPPLWARENNFETLVHIILEQQVSQASALASLKKLKENAGDVLPDTILNLSDEELKACYVSRQKIIYIRGLAVAITNRKIDLDKFVSMSNDNIRNTLIQLKGVGNWTIDMYLMLALGRTDIFPTGDLAAINALKSVKCLPADVTKEDMIQICKNWSPVRSVACMLLWHFYLSNLKKNANPRIQQTC